jgi:hypothetical protein
MAQPQYREQAFNPHHMRVLSNYSHMSGHYKFALSQYEMAYRENKGDYLLVLCIAIIYVNMACQVKQSSNRNAIIIQASVIYLLVV